MKVRSRHAALFIATVSLALTGIQTSSAAPGDGGWEQLSTAAVVNFHEPALYRTADGKLHVMWVQADPDPEDSSDGDDLWHVALDPEGVAGTPTAAITNWSSVWGGGGTIVPTADGGMRYFFGGIKLGTGPNDNLNMLTSDASGATWAEHVDEVVASSDSSASSSTIGGDVALDFTPFQSWGANYHRGIDPSVPAVKLHEVLGWGCCSYQSDIATDQVSGEMFIGWFALADDESGADRSGVWVHEIDPATGAPIGEPMQMPGVAQEYSSESPPASAQADTRIPMIGRPGNEGVYVAYTGGYPVTKKMLVWRVGDATSTVVHRMNGSHEDPAIAIDPDGRMWVVWTHEGEIYASRSNAEGTVWNPPSRWEPPRAVTSLFDLKISAQEDELDIVTVFDTNNAAPAIAHFQAKPRITFTADRSRIRVGDTVRVTFRVTDAGVPIAGAGVRVDNSTVNDGNTDENGRVTLRVGPLFRTGRIPIHASKTGYQGGSLKIRVTN